MNRFEGALLGLSGKYKGLGYELNNLEEVSILLQENEYVLSCYHEENSVCTVFYVCDKEMYCVEPKQNNLIYLESGQPLGKDKQYHLYRKTRIYVNSKNNMIELA